MANPIDIRASELTHEIVFRIRGFGVMKARFWLAARIMVFAAWVGGVGIQIESDQLDD